MKANPQPTIIVYGRHSTSMQTATSSVDQVAPCTSLVNLIGGVVIKTFVDPELPGYRRNRPRLTKIVQAAKAGVVDIIVCESLDRLARDAEDVAWTGKILGHPSVQLYTVSEGHVDKIRFAVAGLLGTIFHKHLVDKTILGMEAAALAGRFAGGRAYGYKRAGKLDAKAEVIPGILEID